MSAKVLSSGSVPCLFWHIVSVGGCLAIPTSPQGCVLGGGEQEEQQHPHLEPCVLDEESLISQGQVGKGSLQASGGNWEVRCLRGVLGWGLVIVPKEADI